MPRVIYENSCKNKLRTEPVNQFDRAPAPEIALSSRVRLTEDHRDAPYEKYTGNVLLQLRLQGIGKK